MTRGAGTAILEGRHPAAEAQGRGGGQVAGRTQARKRSDPGHGPGSSLSGPKRGRAGGAPVAGGGRRHPLEPPGGRGLHERAAPYARARALLAHCSDIFEDDPRLRHLAAASEVMLDAKGLQPDFALACMLVGQLLGLAASEPLFLIGRTVRWVANAMEQYAAGEFEHLDGLYLGPLTGSGPSVFMQWGPLWRCTRHVGSRSVFQPPAVADFDEVAVKGEPVEPFSIKYTSRPHCSGKLTKMVPITGLEPVTPSLRMRCSTS